MLVLMLAVHASAALPTGRVAFEQDVSPRAASGWTRGARADPDALIELLVAVKQPASGVEKMKTVLDEVSDPRSASYGAHLTQHEVHQILAPAAAAVAAVKEHFGRGGAVLEPATTAMKLPPQGDVTLRRARPRTPPPMRRSGQQRWDAVSSVIRGRHVTTIAENFPSTVD